jgi:hypothetical protein
LNTPRRKAARTPPLAFAEYTGATDGRPWRRRLFHVQNNRNPCRCQATTVSGLAITSTVRQPRHTCESQATASGTPSHAEPVATETAEGRAVGGAARGLRGGAPLVTGRLLGASPERKSGPTSSRVEPIGRFRQVQSLQRVRRFQYAQARHGPYRRHRYSSSRSVRETPLRDSRGSVSSIARGPRSSSVTTTSARGVQSLACPC